MTTALGAGQARLVGIDLARCLALISMFIAHVAPSAGPGGVLNLSEFLTVALFATLLGISADLSRKRMGFSALFASSVVRAIALIALGVWLESWGAQVDIVLPYLGLLALVCAVLVFIPTWALALLALVVWWFTPWAISFFASYHQNYLASGSLVRYATGWLFEGESYRVFTMLAWAAAGIVLLRLWQRIAHYKAAGFAELAAALLLSAAAGASWWHAHKIMEFFPYTGNHWEVGLDLLLSLALICWSLLLAHLFSSQERLLSPLLLAGRMTLSIYVLHIGILALYAKYAPVYGLPYRDDSWWMLALLILSALAFAWVWKKIFGSSFLRRGPLETLLALVSGRG